MIEERGRVVAIERDAIWVETVANSGCGGCSAKSACGTGLLGDYFAKHSRIRVSLEDCDAKTLSLHDTVVIGIPENALARGALLVYLLPLVAMLLAALAGERLSGEAGAILGAVGGLLAGLVLVRWHSRRNASNKAYTPRLIRIEPKL